MKTKTKFLVIATVAIMMGLTSCGGDDPATLAPEVVDLTTTPALPSAHSDVVVSVSALDAVGISTVKIAVSINQQAQAPVAMAGIAGKYNTTIAKQAAGTVVSYTVTATNKEGATTTLNGSYTVSNALAGITSGRVYINEVSPASGEWELYNSEDAEVNLTGWRLYNGGKRDAANTFTFPAVTIAAKSFMVLKKGEANAPTFELSATAGFMYELYNSKMNPDLISKLDNLGALIINDNLLTEQSIGRVVDGNGIFATYTKSSIGETNTNGVLYAKVNTAISTRYPVEATTNDIVTVSANLSYSKVISSAKLAYSFDGGATFIKVNATKDANGLLFTAKIPAKGGPTADVIYKFIGNAGGVDVETIEFTYEVSSSARDYSGLVLNELYFSWNFAGMDAYKYVELYNKSASPILLDGVYMIKNGAMLEYPDGVHPHWVALPDTGYLEPGGYLVLLPSTSQFVPGLMRDGIGGPRYGMQIELYSPEGLLLDKYRRGAADNADYALTEMEDLGQTSIQRGPDGTGTWVVANPTPGAANHVTGTVVPINPI